MDWQGEKKVETKNGCGTNFDNNIKIEHGKVDIIVSINWRLNGKVDNHPYGAIINPAKPVVIILIFIAVIEKICADAR